jgi:hypothetical protein
MDKLGTSCLTNLCEQLIDIGVAKSNAHGQVIIKTDIALTNAKT